MTDNKRERVKINRLTYGGISDWATKVNDMFEQGYVLAVSSDSNERQDVHNLSVHPRYVVMVKKGSITKKEVVVSEADVVSEQTEEVISEQPVDEVVVDEVVESTTESEPDQTAEVEKEVVASEKAKPGRKPKSN